MALRVEWVRYGRPAAEALRAAIATAKGGEPLAPVTVVVPSNHVGVATRRLLGAGSLGPVCGRGVGLAAVSFLTATRLAELLAAPTLAAAGRRPVSDPVLAAALRAALAEEPGVFGAVAAHAATEAALVGAYKELRDLDPAALDTLAATGPRAADVVRLGRSARARLVSGWYDEEDLLATATALVSGRRAPAVLGDLVVHLPQRLSRHAATLLAAVGSGRSVVVVAGATAEPAADAEVVASVARLGGGPPPPCPPDPPAAGPAAAGRTRVLTASDPDDEVRAAVRAVVDAARSGTPLDRVAIVYAGRDPYARLVHEHLAAAGIPANGAAVVPVAQRVAGRALLQLLALSSAGFRRRDLFAWLAAAPVLDDGRFPPVEAWERLSRRAGIVAGREEWDQRLHRLAAELEAAAGTAEGDPDSPDWLPRRHREDARHARALRVFALGLLDDVAGAAGAPRAWDHHAAWAKGVLERLLGGPQARAAWPLVEQKAAERVERALDRLAALHTVEAFVDLDVFTRTLELELDVDLGRVGRFGSGVLVGPVGMGLAVDLDLVIVLGLVEGAFPGPVQDDSLLPDDERAAVDDLPLRRHRIGREHRQLLATMAGAHRHFLCVPRGDLRRTAERVPSRWVLDAASALAGRRLWSGDLLTTSAPWASHVASFDAGLRALASPATGQEHRLRALLAGEAVPDPVARAGREVVAARRSDRFTRFDGHLAGLSIPSPAEVVTSPTRLERWATCPFAYLHDSLLRVRAVENPEEQITISPLDRGRLVHEALEDLIAGVLSRPPAERPGPDEPWPPAERARLAAIGGRLCDEYEARGLTGRPLFWRRDRAAILADLDRFLDADDAHRALHRTRPLAAELAFGLPGASLEAVAIPLPDGRSVCFRGKADRVDVDEDAGVHVVDYKTGKSADYDKLCAADPDLRGTKLQLAVYGAAGGVLRDRLPAGAGPSPAPVQAEYWFVSARGRFARVGYPVTADVLDRVSRTLAVMVAGIEAGAFPPRPTATSTSRFVECDPCDPDALGVTELRRSWERKRSDPALAAYAGLSEPLAGVDAQVEVVEDVVRGA